MKKDIEKFDDFVINAKNDKYARIFIYEIKIIQSLMHAYLMNEDNRSKEIIYNITSDFPTNSFSAFLRASLAIHQNKNEEVIKISKVRGEKESDIPYMNFIYGTAYLNKIESKSKIYFANYIRSFKGQSYKDEALLKIGWCYLLENDTTNYKKCIYVIANREALTEENRNVKRETKRYDLYNLKLLKTRLLFDGGYFNDALFTIKSINISGYSKTDLSEYYYRMGRVYEELDSLEKAKKNFTEAVTLGQFPDVYFAPASCYHLGLIAEKLSDNKKGEYWFKRTLEYNNYPQQNSFELRARSGIKRIKKS